MITITEFCQSISPVCLINVFENVKRRLRLCLDHNEEYFEQFLWKLIFCPWSNLNVLTTVRKDTSNFSINQKLGE
jgi:hypothetical protein